MRNCELLCGYAIHPNDPVHELIPLQAGTDLPKDLKDIHTDRVREIQGEPQNDDTWRHLRQSSGHRRWQRYSIPTVNQLKELDDSSRQAALDLPELFGTKRKVSQSRMT